MRRVADGAAARFAALQPEAFFNLWTRKEAWLKATGEGVGRRLSQVEVTFVPGEPARFVTLPSALAVGSNWTLLALEPAAGFVGALAVDAAVCSVDCRQWPVDMAKD